jgi:hypothetical protein
MAEPNTGTAAKAWTELLEAGGLLPLPLETPRTRAVLNGTAKRLLCPRARS